MKPYLQGAYIIYLQEAAFYMHFQTHFAEDGFFFGGCKTSSSPVKEAGFECLTRSGMCQVFANHP
jgi:hypothetical protein